MVTRLERRHSQRAQRARRRAALAVALCAAAIAVGLLYMLGRGDGRRSGSEERLRLVPVRVIDGPGVGEQPAFDGPLGVAVGSDGTIFVADSGNDRICAFSSSGRFLRQWGRFGMTKPLRPLRPTWEPGSLNYPVGVDIGSDGLVYVADFHNDQISVFEPTGRFVRAFPDPRTVVGRGGSGKDGTGIAVTDVSESDGVIAATDTYQVFLFTRQGTLLRQFGKPGGGRSDLDHPTGVDLRGSTIIVSDSNHRRLVAFDLHGTPLWSLPHDPMVSHGGADRSGVFGVPRGVCTTSDGKVLVADPVEHRIVVLDRSGKRLAALGERGLERGQFNFPVDVASLGGMVVVVEKANNRVQVMRLIGDGTDGRR